MNSFLSFFSLLQLRKTFKISEAAFIIQKQSNIENTGLNYFRKRIMGEPNNTKRKLHELNICKCKWEREKLNTDANCSQLTKDICDKQKKIGKPKKTV